MRKQLQINCPKCDRLPLIHDEGSTTGYSTIHQTEMDADWNVIYCESCGFAETFEQFNQANKTNEVQNEK